MNELQVFNYNESQVRTIQKDGEPWFVLKDVCGVLDIKNPSQIADRLDQDEVAMFDIGLKTRRGSSCHTRAMRSLDCLM